MSDILLEMKNIYKYFNGTSVLDGVNFSLEAGEVHVLVGKNGAGKSTLVNILAGMYRQEAGDIYLEGKKVVFGSISMAYKSGISAVHQNLNLFYNMNISEYIFLNQEPKKRIGPFNIIDRKRVYEEAESILKEFNINSSAKTPVKNLNPGEQKFVEVARAIAGDPKIIILDEPTAVLNEVESERLFNFIKHNKSRGVSFIYITHRINEIKEIADRVTLMADGRTVTTIRGSEVDFRKLVSMIANSDIKNPYPKLEKKPGKELLIASRICVGNILKGVSFCVREGEILGVTGLKGAGKTTLAKVLFGAQRMDSGNIYLRGKRLNLKSTVDAVKKGICYISPNKIEEGLILEMSVADNIISANLHGAANNHIIISKTKHAASLKYTKMLGIKAYHPSSKVKYLSGGNQKKVVIAKWLFRISRLVIVNDITSGIDVPSKVDIYNIINSLLKAGVGVILISSDISELLGMCDRILVMYKGEIIKEFSGEKVKREEIIYYTLGGK